MLYSMQKMHTWIDCPKGVWLLNVCIAKGQVSLTTTALFKSYPQTVLAVKKDK